MTADDQETTGEEAVEEQPVAGEAEAKTPLTLEVDVQKPSACQRHVVVKVSPEDVQRYFAASLSEIAPTAHVPGFRPGKAPLKLVQNRFRKEVASQVKGNLLMDSLTQISEEMNLAPISEPDFDFESVELEPDGPLTFEFDLEVRPEFDLPDWKGMPIEKPVRDFTEDDIDQLLKEKLNQFGKLVDHEGPAEAGDYVSLNMAFSHSGQTLAEYEDVDVCVRSTLSFHDGRLNDFDKLISGARANDTREATITLSSESGREDLRGKEVQANFAVTEVQKLELPELNERFLSQIGDYESESQLREAALAELESQLTYHQQQSIRNQIRNLLTQTADWELPPDLVRRQARRERDRALMELQSRGFTPEYIRAHENELRQNILATTQQALQEHFILEKLAEEENIDVTPDDLDQEIERLARQRGDSVRSVRANIEKRGLMDVLTNQILEQKVISLIESHAKVKEVPYEPQAGGVEAVDLSISGEEQDIPEAKYGEDTSAMHETA